MDGEVDAASAAFDSRGMFGDRSMLHAMVVIDMRLEFLMVFGEEPSMQKTAREVQENSCPLGRRELRKVVKGADHRTPSDLLHAKKSSASGNNELTTTNTHTPTSRTKLDSYNEQDESFKMGGQRPLPQILSLRYCSHYKPCQAYAIDCMDVFMLFL